MWISDVSTVNRALVRNLQQACALVLAQRAREFDVALDLIDARVRGFACLAVGRVNLRVL